MSTLLPEPVRRWLRLQKELGIDEVFLDAPWTPPAPEPQQATARRAAPEPRRSAPPPSMPDARRPGGAPPSAPMARQVSTGSTSGGAADLDKLDRRPPPQREPLRPTPAAPAARPPMAGSAGLDRLDQRPQRAPAVPTFTDLAALQEHIRSCSRCILHGKRKALVPQGGAARSTWAVLTLYGWADDTTSGQLLSGTYAAAFLDLVKASGLPEPVVLPVLACAPLDPADTTIQGFTEAVRCRPHWLQALKLHGIRAALVLDHKATQLVRGPSAPVAWPAFRGESWSIDGIPAVSTHHPARLARSAALAPEVASDLQRIKTILETAP